MVAVPLIDRLKIDDPVGAVAVHGFGGAWVRLYLYSMVCNLYVWTH